MISDHINHDSTPSSPTCYFSIPVDSSASHYSVETPSLTPLSSYPEPSNLILTVRKLPSEYHMSTAVDVSSLLQLQTNAAHRPTPRPLQHTSSNSSSSSNSSRKSSSSGYSYHQAMLCCSRCRRESGSGMIQFGTNIYYCNHCARMTGYCAPG
jgi:hypothetical protein